MASYHFITNKKVNLKKHSKYENVDISTLLYLVNHEILVALENI